MGIGSFACAFIDSENAYSLPEINEVIAELASSGCDFHRTGERGLLDDIFTRQDYGVTLVDLKDENNHGWFIHAPDNVWLYSQASGRFKVFFSSIDMLCYAVSRKLELDQPEEHPFGKIERVPQYQTPGWVMYNTEDGTKHFSEMVDYFTHKVAFGPEYNYLSLKDKGGDGIVAIKSQEMWSVFRIYNGASTAPRLIAECVSDKDAVTHLLKIHVDALS